MAVGPEIFHPRIHPRKRILHAQAHITKLNFRRLDILVHADAGTYWMAIAPDVVNTGDGGPEFVLTEPFGGIGRLLARVRVVPSVRGNDFSGMRSVFEEVVPRIDQTGFDSGNFGVNGNEGVAKAIQFFL